MKHSARFSGKTILITGASSGIGAELAHILGREGATLALLARRADALRQVADRCVAAGAKEPLVLACDIADSQAAQEAMTEVIRKLGVPHAVVANAGTGATQFAPDITIKAYKRVMDVNIIGIGNTLIPFLKPMTERGSGQLIAVSSLGAYRGMPGSAAYSASKAAVVIFMEGLQVDLRGTGVNVLTVLPGFVATPMTAPNRFRMPFLLQADEAAEVIASAIDRNRAGRLAFPWQTQILMGALKRLPDSTFQWLMAKMAPKKDRKKYPG